MPSLLTVMPSRSRPDRAAEAIHAWGANLSGETDSHLALVLDDDDPELPNYRSSPHTKLCVGSRLDGMAPMVQRCVDHHPGYDFYMFMGDDHVIRTPRWDATLTGAIEAAGGWGIAYGDDKLQGANLPTAAVISANIVQTLGWMCLPGLRHLYIDEVWRELGRAAGMLHYRPDIIIEHMHYLNHKAPKDEGYTRANAPEMYAHDKRIFRRWHPTQRLKDARNIQAAAGQLPIKWTIAILTIPSRIVSFTKLITNLRTQIRNANLQNEIEILVADQPGGIGEKRQWCLDKAQGQYFCFIDDDDEIAPDYITSIHPLLDGIDYIGFIVRVVQDGRRARPAYHSLRYKKWFQDRRAYYRNISHLNPIRTEIARTGRYTGNYGEDRRWAEMVHPRTEHYINRTMYTYLHSSTGSEALKLRAQALS